MLEVFAGEIRPVRRAREHREVKLGGCRSTPRWGDSLSAGIGSQELVDRLGMTRIRQGATGLRAKHQTRDEHVVPAYGAAILSASRAKMLRASASKPISAHRSMRPGSHMRVVPPDAISFICGARRATGPDRG